VLPASFFILLPVGFDAPASAPSSESDGGLACVLDASLLLELWSPPRSSAGLVSSAQPKTVRTAITRTRRNRASLCTDAGVVGPLLASFFMALSPAIGGRKHGSSPSRRAVHDGT
jgi:hypothetical protein